MKICRLQCTFHHSGGYLRRVSPRAHIGLAFHNSIQRLARGFPEASGNDDKWLRAYAVKVLREELGKERKKALGNPRESALPWPEKFLRRLEVSIALIVGENVRKGRMDDYSQAIDSGARRFVEKTLTSRTGLITGRPDLVKVDGPNVTIIEYKTGDLEEPDRLALYSEQCMLYAWLWYENHDMFPTEYHIFNPITGQAFENPINGEEVKKLVDENILLLENLDRTTSPWYQASVDSHCGLCEFRPWCEPFWKTYADSPFLRQTGDRFTRISLMGVVKDIEQLGKNSLHSILRVSNAGVLYNLEVNPIFGQIVDSLRSRITVRIIDGLVIGDDPKWVRLDTWSELFVVH